MSIITPLQNVRNQIIDAAHHYDRQFTEVKLIAVSKGQPVEAIRQVYIDGQRQFGENYVQEAFEKIQILADLTDIEWHFIGQIQRNKTRIIAEHFDWVQSLDQLLIAERLNKQRPCQLEPLNVCIQINIDAEPQKAGIYPHNLLSFARAITDLPYLRLRGLMAIPAERTEQHTQHKIFSDLYQLFLNLKKHFPNVDTLSMGMSHDFVAAIAEGATMVRIGTAIFGERKRKNHL